MPLPEITAAVDLCDRRGRLNRATGAETVKDVTVPLARGVELAPSAGGGRSHVEHSGLSMTFEEVEGGTRLLARTEEVELDVIAGRPAGHEALGVVVPWSDRLFQYTLKDVARPVAGSLTVTGRPYAVVAGESWAVLDHGRGRWPYAMTWNWAAGSGTVEGRVLGLQLGGRWTSGTPATENALLVDGRLHKLHEEVAWDYDRSDWLRPWRIHGDRVEVTFTPFHERVARTNLLVVASQTHQCFGHFSGWVVDDHGSRVAVDGLLGWAEEARNRW